MAYWLVFFTWLFITIYLVFFTWFIVINWLVFSTWFIISTWFIFFNCIIIINWFNFFSWSIVITRSVFFALFVLSIRYSLATRFDFLWRNLRNSKIYTDSSYLLFVRTDIMPPFFLVSLHITGKKGALSTTSLELEFHLQFPRDSPSTELSDFRQSVQSGNERECKQTLKNT